MTYVEFIFDRITELHVKKNGGGGGDGGQSGVCTPEYTLPHLAQVVVIGDGVVFFPEYGIDIPSFGSTETTIVWTFNSPGPPVPGNPVPSTVIRMGMFVRPNQYWAFQNGAIWDVVGGNPPAGAPPFGAVGYAPVGEPTFVTYLAYYESGSVQGTVRAIPALDYTEIPGAPPPDPALSMYPSGTVVQLLPQGGSPALTDWSNVFLSNDLVNNSTVTVINNCPDWTTPPGISGIQTMKSRRR